MAHPDVTHEELTRILGSQDLSKQYFFNMRNQLRKKGKIPAKQGSMDSAGSGVRKYEAELKPPLVGSVVEILETVDTSNFSEEVKANWKEVVLPSVKGFYPEKSYR